MADLLSGIYALAEQGERWQRRMLATIADRNAAARNRPPGHRETLDRALARREPRFTENLAAASSPAPVRWKTCLSSSTDSTEPFLS
ncbi:hypothetical protein ACFQ0M_00925 [Kitasatospora aburaviensis]